MRIFVVIALLALAGSFLSACNTMSGIGEDIRQGGQAIKRAAD